MRAVKPGRGAHANALPLREDLSVDYRAFAEHVPFLKAELVEAIKLLVDISRHKSGACRPLRLPLPRGIAERIVRDTEPRPASGYR